MTPQQRAELVISMGARPDWWTLQPEPVLEPDWEIIDAHCHFWIEKDVPDPASPGDFLRTSRYLPEEFLRDTAAGHRLSAFVYIECGSGHYPDGPVPHRPVGETEFAAGIAAELDRMEEAPKLAAISAFADLANPGLDEVLDRHAAKGTGLVRAIRQSGARIADPSARLLAGAAREGLYLDPAFRRGAARLGERGLLFEAFQFHFQLMDLAELAKATPGTTFIVNHLGAPIGYGGGGQAEARLFRDWAKGIEALARLPNTVMKLGGLASPVTGYDGCFRDKPPSSSDFVAERGAYFYHAIEAFGADRCLFESNFPVDSAGIGYTGLWNAFKLIARDYPTEARTALLSGTARRLYNIPEMLPSAQMAPTAPNDN
ncbi:MAG: amidohydrolase [Alphaproteobacteria bacterium]|nr:MAG: amidohydrolase [Alphaproteobacteria bacterium]